MVCGLVAKVKPKYRATLNRYLLWFDYIHHDSIPEETNLYWYFPVEKDLTAETPEVIMRDWESCGVKIPNSCTNPLLLWKYIRGKTSRDYTITEWIGEIKLGTFFIQEVVDDLLKLGEDPARVFQGIRNNYQNCYPKQWYSLIINKIDPCPFFDNLEQTNQEWQTIHSVLQ